MIDAHMCDRDTATRRAVDQIDMLRSRLFSTFQKRNWFDFFPIPRGNKDLPLVHIKAMVREHTEAND